MINGRRRKPRLYADFVEADMRARLARHTAFLEDVEMRAIETRACRRRQEHLGPEESGAQELDGGLIILDEEAARPL
jgi:hypothetical protein